MPSTMRISCLLSIVFVGALFLSTAGCPGNKTDPDEIGGRSCNTDRECASGFICQRELQRCVCTSDAACAEGLFCNAFTGQCVESVPGCTSDSDCQSGQYCDIPTRTCRPRRAFCDSCTEHVECGGPSDRCLRDPTNNRNYCGQYCSGDGECPEGASCQMMGGERTCWPIIATCEQFVGCNPNSGQPCEANEDCTEGEDQICDQTQNICVARVPTCPYGMVCGRESKQCEAACVTDDDCYASDASCDPDNSPCRCTNNECVGVSVCRQDTDCEAGRICIIEPGQTEGECRSDCAGDDSLCPQGHLCQDRGSRYDCVPGCRTNTDCTVSQNCIGGTCRVMTTTGKQYCQMPEVCELCEGCRLDTEGGSTCQQVSGTCQTCSAPAGGCSGTAPTFCCAIFTNTGYRGIDCTGGQLCPSGHQCVDIMVGSTLYGNCFPTSDSVCDAPSCQ